MPAEAPLLDHERLLSIGPSRTWKAAWIWSPEETPDNTYWLFRKSFELPQRPAAATLFVSAETRCQVFINGHFLARAPKPSQPWLQYYHAFDVTAALRPGANSIAAVVYVQGERQFCQPGLLAEIAADDGSTLVGTDASWRVCRGEAWSAATQKFPMNHFARYQEHVDLRKLPVDWPLEGFDDAAWPRATYVPGRGGKATGHAPRVPAAGPWSRLLPNPLPAMTDEPVRPVAITRTEEAVDLTNRQRPADLSISLSQAGQNVQRAHIDNAEALLAAEGATELRCFEPTGADRYLGRWDPTVVLDFGRVITAYPALTVEAPEGATLEIGYAERLLDGHFNNAVEGWFADRVVFREGRDCWMPFTWKAFRYLKLRLKHCGSAPLRITDLHARVTTYPFEERGAFTCEDADLRGAWHISRETIRLCSNEFLMDTPWREAAQWLGDVASVTLGGIQACFGDTRLPREFYRQTAANQHQTGLISNVSNFPNVWMYGAIPDYSLEWLIFLWEHYLLTGDEVFLEETYPVALRVIQAFLPNLNAYGLVEDINYWHLIDWAHIDRRGEGAPMNALFYGALEALAKIAETLGDARWAGKAEHIRTVLRAHFQERLWDERHGCFADCRVGDQLSERHSEHASMAAIRFGLADDAATAAILNKFYEAPRSPEDPLPYSAECEPFFTVFVLQALDRAGRFDLALQVIRERWGRRMLDRGATSCFEEWSDNGTWRNGSFHGQMRTHSHAWSGAPAEFLITNLIGLRITEPGCRAYTLNPKKTDFPYTATYPFPDGRSVTVRWDGRTHAVEEG
jgi:hypothetical protein